MLTADTASDYKNSANSAHYLGSSNIHYASSPKVAIVAQTPVPTAGSNKLISALSTSGLALSDISALIWKW